MVHSSSSYHCIRDSFIAIGKIFQRLERIHRKLNVDIFNKDQLIFDVTALARMTTNVASSKASCVLISRDLVNKILSWKHAGFYAWIGPAITDMKEIVEIGLYAVRAPAAVGRLVLGNESYVKYVDKGTQPDRDIGGLFKPLSRSFEYLDWIARLTSHMPEKGMQLSDNFTSYSNAHRGRAAKAHSKPCSDVTVETAPAESEEDWIQEETQDMGSSS